MLIVLTTLIASNSFARNLIKVYYGDAYMSNYGSNYKLRCDKSNAVCAGFYDDHTAVVIGYGVYIWWLTGHESTQNDETGEIENIELSDIPE